MRVTDIVSAYQTETLTRAQQQAKEEESGSTPFSWGSDSVRISEEARAAQQSAAAGRQRDAGGEEEESASAAFSKYMDKARGGASASGAESVEEQIQELKDKLKKLMDQYAKVASQDLPESTKSAMMDGLNQEINQLIGQIAQLESEALQQSAEA